MPINAASQSIHLGDELAKTHSVQFIVHTSLAVPDVEQLHPHVDAHLRFLERLNKEGILGVSGPFFTEDGRNTGDGLYVLRVDDIETARRVAAEDPLHKAGVRVPVVQPWLEKVY